MADKNKDLDYQIEIQNELSYFNYPIQNYKNSEITTHTNFLVDSNNFWHNGIHLYTNEPLINIGNGEVIAYRLTNNYKVSNSFDSCSIPSKILEYLGILNTKYNSYFDINENKQYVLKKDLTNTQKEDLYRYINELYSNNFILMKYKVLNSNKDSISFFALYNHLKPIQRMTVFQKSTLPWFNFTIRLDSVSNYTYINLYEKIDNNGLKNKKTIIPSETEYSFGDIKYIQWSINNKQYRGYINDNKIITWSGKNTQKKIYEIKSLNADNKSGNYLKSEDIKNKIDTIFIFDTSTKSNRKVIADPSSLKRLQITKSYVDFKKYLETYKSEKDEYKRLGLEVIYNAADNQRGFIYFSLDEFNTIYNTLNKYEQDYYKNAKAGDDFYKIDNSILYIYPNVGIFNTKTCIVPLNFSMTKHSNYVEINYVKQFNQKGELSNFQEKTYIPCETKITYENSDYLHIICKLNGSSISGFVDKKDIRIPEKNKPWQETKRINNVYEETDNKYYLPRSSPSKNDKIVVYSTGGKGNRTVQGYAKNNEFSIIDFSDVIKLFNLKKTDEIYRTGIKVKYTNTEYVNQIGYIYPNWDSLVINSDVSSIRKHSTNDLDNTIKKQQELFNKWLNDIEDNGTYKLLNLFTIKYSIDKSITKDVVKCPNNLEIKKGQVIGYAGYKIFTENGEPDKEIENEDATSIHFEIFTKDVNFMNFKPSQKYKCKLIAKNDVEIQEGNLKLITENKSIFLGNQLIKYYSNEQKISKIIGTSLLSSFFKPNFLPDVIKESLSNCVLKLDGNPKTILDETFYKMKFEAILKPLEYNEYINHADFDKWEPGAANTNEQGYWLVNKDKFNIPLYDSNFKQIPGKTINLYKSFKYMHALTRNSNEGNDFNWAGEKSTSKYKIRRPEFIYEKISITESLEYFYIKSSVFKELYCWNNNYYLFNNSPNRKSILAEEIFEEPVKKEWEGERQTLSKKQLNNISYVNKQVIDNLNIEWEQIQQNKTLFWVKKTDISEDDSHPIKKIIYDKWNKFFKEIKISESDKYYISDKDTFLDSLNLDYNKSKYKDESQIGDILFDYRTELYPFYFKHVSEWKDNPDSVNKLIEQYPLSKKYIEQQHNDLEFWDELTDLKLQNECYYFNPTGFLNHMDKIITPEEFNPYKNAQIAYYSSPENRKKGLLSYQTVIDNPGFAPLYTSGNAVYEYNGERFAITTGLFNEDYQHLKAYRHLKEFYHEGVDFRGSWDKNKPNEKGTPVKALINCKVIAYGWYSTYGQVIFMSKTNDVGIYLIAHLSFYADDIKVGKEYLPGEIVGYVGGSGKDKKTGKYELDCWDSHLHVSYYNILYTEKMKITTKNDEISFSQNTYTNLITFRKNPFIHNSENKKETK